MPVPLYDLVVPTDGIALPAALLHVLKGHFQGKRARRAQPG